MLAASVCDRPRFNTKSILLQSAITVCWLKQMAEMEGTPAPVSMAPLPQRSHFLWAESFRRVSFLSLSLSKCTALFF